MKMTSRRQATPSAQVAGCIQVCAVNPLGVLVGYLLTRFETPEGTDARTEEEAHKGAAAAGGQKAGKEWGPQEP